MTKTNLFEIFITNHNTRIALVEAANLYDALDRAFNLFPTVDFRKFIAIPTTFERVVG